MGRVFLAEEEDVRGAGRSCLIAGSLGARQMPRRGAWACFLGRRRLDSGARDESSADGASRAQPRAKGASIFIVAVGRQKPAKTSAGPGDPEITGYLRAGPADEGRLRVYAQEPRRGRRRPKAGARVENEEEGKEPRGSKCLEKKTERKPKNVEDEWRER